MTSMQIIAKNKRGRYDYAITDTMVAGLVLSGAEVKSVKAGHISLKGSYVSVRGGEAYLVGAHINPLAHAVQPDYQPTRARKLLMHAAELAELMADKQRGLQTVPLAVGVSRGYIKVELGRGRGQKRYDKREVIKQRDMARDAARGLSSKRHS